MKKSFIVCLCMALNVTILHAQQTTAVLTHEGNSQFFHGINALISAHEAAVDGDEIILSEGNFNLPEEITKAVRICGAGFRNDSVYSQTNLLGTIVLNIPETATKRFTLEGIQNNSGVYNRTKLANAAFFKCFINNVLDVSDAPVINMTLMHCYISESLNAPSSSGINCLNSVIANAYNQTGSSSISFQNCVVIMYNTSFRYLENCYMNSCVLCPIDDTDAIPASTNAVYNTTYAGASQIFSLQSNNTNTTLTSSTSYPFKNISEYAPSVKVNIDYQLDQTNNYVYGQDGTQPGVYGGSNPFSYIPTSRRVIKYEVANETTNDDKLNIKVTMK